MRRFVYPAAALLCAILALGGCSPAARHDTPSVTPILTVTPAPGTPSLETVTDPYQNAGALLDGVCFEFLYGLSGTTWVWTTPGDLAAFYDRADDSGLCPAPAARATFDFTDAALVGAVQTATGCDAAHYVTGTTTGETAHTVTITAEFVVRGGCPYDLLEPLLIAVPRPAGDYTLRLALLP